MKATVTRKEAFKMGLSRGRLDYLLQHGEIEYVGPKKRLDKELVEKFAAIPSHGQLKERKKAVQPLRGMYFTKVRMAHAIIALRLCASLHINNQRIRDRFGAKTTAQDLIDSANAVEKLLKAELLNDNK